jgi:hypothetical protein
MLVQWIDDEEDSVHHSFHHPVCDLNVATVRSRFQALYRQAHLLDQQSASGASCDQVTSLQSLTIESRESNEVCFLAIVRNDCDTWRANARHFILHWFSWFYNILTQHVIPRHRQCARS